MLLHRKKRIHFVGMGGIGMSGIAFVLLEMGYKISGSDLELNNLTQNIKFNGGDVFEGHKSLNILNDVGVVVYSSSVSDKNPEIIEARRRKIPIAHRAEILAELFNKKRGIAVTGTHGKTTTTSLIAVMFENSGLDPTVIIGGEVSQFKGNAKFGNGEYLIAEADESDGSFLRLKPFCSVITNIEMEHMDYYKTLDEAKASYRAFCNNLKNGGTLFYNFDDVNMREILKGLPGKKMSFGFSKEADIYPSEIKMNEFKTSFKCVYKNKSLGSIGLNIPGRHNVLNALAAILVGLNAGLTFNKIASSIRGFRGAKRRFHLRADKNGIMLIDDYAHHPTEIRTVLEACRNWDYNRLIAIFQPHRYTRTKALADEFGRSFDLADILILTDIYAASERPIKGVSIKNIYDRVKKNGLEDVRILKKEEIADHVMELKRSGDMVVVMGAGDIKKVADELADRLNGHREFLGSIAGGLKFKEDLSRHTSFKIGGPADVWFEPKDVKDLKKMLIYAKSNKTPIFVIGNGSNLLVKDDGFSGIVIHFGAPNFKKVDIRKSIVRVGGGFSLSQLVRLTCSKGLGGLESLVGIPGTVGGAIYMNAGGSTNPIFKNIGDMATSLKVMDYNGNVKILKRKKIDFGYRHSNLEPYIILEATLKLKKDNKDALVSRCSKFLKMKGEKQALDVPSAGCVFKNPDNFQFTCGQMIDMLGLKGKRIGGAEVSKKHANFLINRDRATCSDVLNLIDFIRDRVRENYNVELNLEIKII